MTTVDEPAGQRGTGGTVPTGTAPPVRNTAAPYRPGSSTSSTSRQFPITGNSVTRSRADP